MDTERIPQNSPLQKAAQCIASEGLFRGIRHVDVALSGGADSVCLLAILATLPHDFTLRAHHVRHRLRARDDVDAQIAARTAQRFGVPFIQTDLHWDGSPHSDIENRARDARYAALTKALEGIPDAALAVAHHGDENLETTLWRLGRGCGLEGLTLAPRRVLGDIAIVRPLLMLSKDEIYEFLREQDIEWAEDPTNQSDDYRRNRIRHRILPELKRESMSEACLFRSLATIRRDADALAALADDFVRRHAVPDAPGWFCPWHDWDAVPDTAQAQILRHAARAVATGHCPTEAFVSSAVAMLQTREQTHRKTEDSAVCVEWSRAGVVVQNRDHQTAARELPEFPLEIPCFGQPVADVCRLSLWTSTPGTVPVNTPNALHFEFHPGHYSVLPASRFATLTTSRGSLCKLTKALHSMGIPECYKTVWPILCRDAHPLWLIGGMRTDLAIPASPHAIAATCLIEWTGAYIFQ